MVIETQDKSAGDWPIGSYSVSVPRWRPPLALPSTFALANNLPSSAAPLKSRLPSNSWVVFLLSRA